MSLDGGAEEFVLFIDKNVASSVSAWHSSYCIFFLSLQVLEFDLKGTALDSSSNIDVIVKDYETIGKDK